MLLCFSWSFIFSYIFAHHCVFRALYPFIVQRRSNTRSLPLLAILHASTSGTILLYNATALLLTTALPFHTEITNLSTFPTNLAIFLEPLEVLWNTCIFLLLKFVMILAGGDSAEISPRKVYRSQSVRVAWIFLSLSSPSKSSSVLSRDILGPAVPLNEDPVAYKSWTDRSKLTILIPVLIYQSPNEQILPNLCV